MLTGWSMLNSCVGGCWTNVDIKTQIVFPYCALTDKEIPLKFMNYYA